MTNKVRVRFAPSPTGPLHLGGVRTLLFNFLYAKRHGGDFILRVEDTDSKREIEGSIKYITDSLAWLGIPVDESPDKGGEYGPYTQSERKDIYKEHVERLIDSGNAYYAFDTKEDLAKMRDDFKAAGVKNGGYTGATRDRMKNSTNMSADAAKAKIDAGDPYVIRFKMPRGEDVKYEDAIRGWITFNTNHLDDKVIWKSSDGLPTYHLANVVDDHLMEISHVIRGEEWVSSTPLHMLLYKAFGWDNPVYAHLPLILGPDGKKLGKRNKYGILVFPLDWTYTDGEGVVTDIEGFREAGYESDALVNFLALLGWNPGDNIEHMTMKEMIESFSLDRVNKAGARFDKKKLDSFNAHYLRNWDKDKILERIGMSVEFLNSMTNKKLDLIAEMAVERAVLVSDLEYSLDYLWNRPTLEGELKLKNVSEFEKVMEIFLDKDFMDDFDKDDWTPEHIRHAMDNISNNQEIKVGKIMPMLRLALAGGKSGPQLPDIMYILGPKETKKRVMTLLSKIKEEA